MNHYKMPFIFSLCFLFLLPSSAYSNTFIPNIFTDEVDTLLGDGNCLGASGNCSLRAAIQESNALAGSHTILLGSGTYRLSLNGRDENESESGDLDIKTNITIEGEGADNTIIDGFNIDRVFDIKNVPTTLRNLSVTRGSTRVLDTNGVYQSGGLGGGIQAINSTLTIDNVWLYSNSALGMGGGIFTVLSTLNVEHSLFYKNDSATGGGIASINSQTRLNESFFLYHGNSDAGSSGGGIFNHGNLTITKSIFLGNRVGLDGGGIYHGLGQLSISNSTIADNRALRNGGGLYYRMGQVGKSSPNDDTPVLRNVSITGNFAGGTDKSGGTGLPEPNFILDVAAFDSFGTADNRLTFDISFDVPGPLGDSDGAIGGGGVMIAGQVGQNQQRVSLTIVNSIVAGNTTGSNVIEECGTTTESEILSLGGNVSSDGTCNFSNSLDLPNTTFAELGLTAFDNSSDILRNSFSIYAYGNVTPHTLMNQSYYDQLSPQTLVFSSDSPLRGAAVGSECPIDDQLGQARVDCDIGAYEFAPPSASPMQFVTRSSEPVISMFAVPGPATSEATYHIVTPPSQGVTFQPGGFSSPSWTYNPNTNASGDDSFVYRACYPSIGECTNDATVRINFITDTNAATGVTINIADNIDARRDGIITAYRYPAAVDRVDIINEADLISGLEDTEYSFPFGAMFFSVENIAPPETGGLVRVTVMLQLPIESEIPPDVQIRKLDNTGVWRTLPTFGSNSTGTFDPVNKTITLTLVDNDIFDLNPTVGIIRDPVALGVPIKTDNASNGIQITGAGGALNIVYSLLLFLLIGTGRLLRTRTKNAPLSRIFHELSGL